jgi:hypothetical protein
MSLSGEPDLPHHRIERLAQDRHLRHLGVVALCAGALPVGLGSDGALWFWELVGTSSPAEILRLAVPFGVGLGLLLLSAWPRGTRLGQGCAALFLLVSGVGVFSDSQLAYSQLFTGLMSFVGRQPAVVVWGFVLLATGAEIRSEARLRRLSSWLLCIGAGLLLLLYGLPQRGAPLVVELAAPASRLLSQGKHLEIVALSFWWLCAVVPFCVAIWGLLAARHPGPPGLLGSVARYGLVGLAILMSTQILFRGLGGPALALHLRAALLLGVTVGVASRALEGILCHLLADPLPIESERSDLARDVALRERLRGLCSRVPEHDTRNHAWMGATLGGWLHPWLKRLMTQRVIELSEELFLEVRDPRLLTRDTGYDLLARLTAGDSRPERRPLALRALETPLVAETLLVLFGVIAVLPYAWASQPPAPDLSWRLRSPTSQEAELFTQKLPDYLWRVGRRKADQAMGASSIESAMEERDARQDLLARARELDPPLADRLEHLEGVLTTSDLAGERWVDATLPLNDRIRELGLPYYLDPQVYEFGPPKKRLRVFFLVAYRVERVQRFRWQERELAALHVKRADGLGAMGDWLGYVRWQEPFAKVLVQEIEEHVATKLSAVAMQRCGLDDLASILPPELWALLRDATKVLGARASLREAEIDHLCGKIVLDALALQGADPTQDLAKARELLVGLHIQATTRHELQHQVDGPDARVPPEVLAALPLADDRTLARVTGEASAYLTEIATSEAVMSTWVLGQLTGFVLRPFSDPRYRFAAAVALAAIAEEEMLDQADAPRIEALTRLWQRLAALPPTERGPWLSERARAARAELLGDAPARPELIEVLE